jgi:hypothetical protein
MKTDRKAEKLIKAVLGYSPNFISCGVKCRLNASLLLDGKINKKVFKELCRIHRKKDKTILLMEKTMDVPKLRKLAEKITKLEFHLQRLWGFPEDINFHKGWLLPGCSCPSMDWSDAYPHQRVISGGCCLHAGAPDCDCYLHNGGE